MKKYIKGLLGIVLVSSLCGCGRIDSRQNHQAVSEMSLEKASDSQSEKKVYVPLGADITEPEGDALSIGHQLYTIVKEREKWQLPFPHEEDYMGHAAWYTVTDLDQNGRLELIASTGGLGSGLYTHNIFWEIDETGHDLVKYQWDETDESGARLSYLWRGKEFAYSGISQVNISDSDNVIDTVYIDHDKKEYYYGVIGHTHLSGTENYSSINLWKYGTKGGGMERLGECAQTIEKIPDDGLRDYVDQEKNKYRSFDTKGNGHKLDGENYNLDDLAKQYGDSLEKQPVAISWKQFGVEYQMIRDMSDAQLLHGLEISYQEFGIGKKTEPVNFRLARLQQEGLPFDKVDWEELKYWIPEKDYKHMWNYIPALKSEQRVIDTEGKEIILSEYLADQRLGGEIQVLDVTGDGVPEIFLDHAPKKLMDDYDVYEDGRYYKTLILSKQGNDIYLYDRIAAYELAGTGVIMKTYDDKLNETEYVSLVFENHQISEKLLAKEICDSDSCLIGYQIGGKEVTESEFSDWEDEFYFSGTDTWEEWVPRYDLCEK